MRTNVPIAGPQIEIVVDRAGAGRSVGIARLWQPSLYETVHDLRMLHLAPTLDRSALTNAKLHGSVTKAFSFRTIEHP
jgi:hypothetical protein